MTHPDNRFTIKANEPWLQEAPRSTWEIILKLFPHMIPKVKKIYDAAVEVAHLLAEEGYLPAEGLYHLPWDLVWTKPAAN